MSPHEEDRFSSFVRTSEENGKKSDSREPQEEEVANSLLTVTVRTPGDLLWSFNPPIHSSFDEPCVSGQIHVHLPLFSPKKSHEFPEPSVQPTSLD